MLYETLFALAIFAFVSSITPGPNNLMLMASGANFGFSRTMPHLLGVFAGFTAMIVLVGLGLAAVFEAYPVAHLALKIGSIGYLLFLAYKIATATAPAGAKQGGKPLSFMQAVLFQWVNPKALAMALTAVTVYAPGNTYVAILAAAAVFGAINLPCISFWTALGQQLRHVLNNTARLRVFNGVMAALLVASLYPVLFS